MNKIIPAIDIHSHLGNILYPPNTYSESGENIIFKTGIKFPPSTGLQRIDEKTLFREPFYTIILNKLLPMWSVNCERKRNAAATLQNFKDSFSDTAKTGIEIKYCACLPVAPNTTYEDIREAAKTDSRIIAFTSPDFTNLNYMNMNMNMKKKLLADLQNGASGVKIHPIIQETEADSKEVMEAVEVVSKHSKPVPVLLHCGKATYYTPKENKKQFAEYASPARIKRLISAFPGVRFIVGHAGLSEMRAVIDLMSEYKNVYVDTSFQPPEAITTLISVFGGDKVLFASDWPYGLRNPALLAVIEACGGDDSLLKAVLYDNAYRVLGLQGVP